jgi:hypothetical protein
MALVMLQTLFQDAFPCNCNGSISFTARRDNTGRRGRRVRENRPQLGAHSAIMSAHGVTTAR